jgi:predicted lipoprotein with Yx(FWY)xxD motif
MRTSRKVPIAALGAAALLAGCGSSSKSSSTTSSSTSAPASSASGGSAEADAVRAASNAKLGTTVLVDAHGMTLYSLSAEHGGTFICTSAACLQAWHPLTSASGNPPKANVAALGVVKRPDGSEQVTYKGMPLYTFALDRAPGSVSGQGIKDVGTWRAVTAAPGTASAPAAGGTAPAPTSTTPTTPTTSTESSHGGYAY